MKLLKTEKVATVLFLSLTGVMAPAQTAGSEGKPISIAFVGVSVIPMDREVVLKNQTVIVRDGKIAQMGPSSTTSIPEGTQKIEAKGEYLIPGLTDAHVHLQTTTEFPLFLANGVTTVFNLDGRPAHLKWRKGIAAGELLGPTIFTTGPIFTRAHKPEDAVRMVDEQAALGYDGVKIYNPVSKEEYPALIAEAKKKNMLLMGHVARGPDLEMTLAAGQSIAHLEEYTYTFFNPKHDNDNTHIVYDESKIPEAVTLTAKSGISVTPTLSTYATIVEQATDLERFLKRPELRYDAPWILEGLQPGVNRYQTGFTPDFYPRIRASLALQRKLVKELEDAMVPILCGTDASDVGPVAGFGIHEELQELVNDGFTPYQALQTATRNPARYFRQSEVFGTIEKGMRADFVLLDGNPIADIRNTRKIAGVMLGGRWISKADLDRALAAVPQVYARNIHQLRLALVADPVEAVRSMEDNDPFGAVGQAALLEIASGDGIGALKTVAKTIREKQPSSELVSERAVNALGYELLRQKKYPDAIALLKMNAEDYPKSANTWDSLGEAQFNAGEVSDAVENYKKALAVDPNYPNAVAAREFIEKHQAKE